MQYNVPCVVSGLIFHVYVALDVEGRAQFNYFMHCWFIRSYIYLFILSSIFSTHYEHWSEKMWWRSGRIHLDQIGIKYKYPRICTLHSTWVNVLRVVLQEWGLVCCAAEWGKGKGSLSQITAPALKIRLWCNNKSQQTQSRHARLDLRCDAYNRETEEMPHPPCLQQLFLLQQKPEIHARPVVSYVGTFF